MAQFTIEIKTNYSRNRRRKMVEFDLEMCRLSINYDTHRPLLYLTYFTSKFSHRPANIKTLTLIVKSEMFCR